MNLTNWLKGLSESFQHKQTPLEQFEYLAELKSWTLTDEQWLELKAAAKRRQTFFPKIAELEALSQEVKCQTASSKPFYPWAETFEHEGRRYVRRRS